MSNTPLTRAALITLLLDCEEVHGMESENFYALYKGGDLGHVAGHLDTWDPEGMERWSRLCAVAIEMGIWDDPNWRET
jgi:hypothetical protein